MWFRRAVSKRFLFVITALLFSTTLGIAEWFSFYYSVPTFILYYIWISLFMTLFFFVIESNLSFPDQLLFSLVPFLVALSTIMLTFLPFIPFLSVLWWVVMFVSGWFMYLVLLTVNIINVATVRTVPLLKAAHATLLFITVVFSTISSFYLLYYLSEPEIVGFWWFFLSILISVAFLYSSQIEVVEEFLTTWKVPFFEGLLVAILEFFIVVLTSAWDVSRIVRVIYWVSSLMVMLVLITGRRKRTLTRTNARELTFIVWIIFVMVIISGIR